MTPFPHHVCLFCHCSGECEQVFAGAPSWVGSRSGVAVFDGGGGLAEWDKVESVERSGRRGDPRTTHTHPPYLTHASGAGVSVTTRRCGVW